MAFASHYLEAEVHGADPMQLVRILYRGAGESVAAARRHLAAGAIRERSRAVVKAWGLVGELSRSLDREHGGELSRSLAELYAYMQTRLMEANASQSEAPLIEVERLLGILGEAWTLLSAS